MSSICALCGVSLPSAIVTQDSQHFCCHGCLAVYQVLQAHGELDSFQEHPIFRTAVQHGLISNPDLLDQLSAQEAPKPEEVRRIYLEITNLWCPSCADVIQWILVKKTGVISAHVDYATDIARIEYDPKKIGREEVVQVITGLGYQTKSVAAETTEENRPLYRRAWVAAFFALQTMMLSVPIYASIFSPEQEGYRQFFAWLSFFSALPVLLLAGWPLFRRGIQGMRVGYLSMESYVTIAASSATAYSVWHLLQGSHEVYFDSIAAICVFVLFGRLLETRAKRESKDVLYRLHRMQPRRMRKRREDGSQEFVLAKEMRIDDVSLVLMGEVIALEGEILEGSALVDESSITGEIIPQQKKVGDRVTSGTVVRKGWLLYRVTNLVDDSTVSRVLAVIENDLAKTAPEPRLVDRLSRLFIPAVIALALGTGLFTWYSLGSFAPAMLRALAVLLISCPCSIGLAAPVVDSYLIYGLASRGMMVRNRRCLGFLGRESVWLFDKTGTVTEGVFQLLHGWEELSSEDQQAVASLATYSLHPICQAIAEKNPLQGGVERIEEIPSRGMRGVVDGVEYAMGSRDFFSEQRISTPEEPSTLGGTVVYIAREGKSVGRLELGDHTREEVPRLLAELGQDRAWLVSGDRTANVERVAKECGFLHWRGRMNPLAKRQVIVDLQSLGHVVAMVGDGINDAPALAKANIAYSVLRATDSAVEVSDILLTGDLRAIFAANHLGKRARRITKQNLVWSFSYNVAGIGLAMAGQLTPLFAAIAMICSSLFVVGNASRLR